MRGNFLLLSLCLVLLAGQASAFQLARLGSTFAALRSASAAKSGLTQEFCRNLRGGCAKMSASTLFDMPVSNNGARCRLIIYKKGLSADEVVIKPPSELGGLKSEEFLKINPQGKMPVLVTPDAGNLPESDTIARYLLDKYSDKAPTFKPSTVAMRACSELLCRLHDTYITTIQGCLYKASPPFGIHSMRTAALADLKKQLLVLNDAAEEAGPYLAGSELSLADATVFPTLIFVVKMMPKFEDGWSQEACLGPRVHKWFEWIRKNDEHFAKIYDEVAGALDGWDAAKRWDTIHLAGKRDTADATIFDKIIAKQIPSDIVFEDEHCLVFRDVNPQAPTHLLVIPRKREGLTQLRFAQEDHKGILGHMMCTIAKVAEQEKLEGYRVVINDGASAQQSVFHVHMHVIGGRAMNWPPG
mmetsp:Transcript_56315/g.138215  ORF Transcript_56315/g.138215 Transcript_56315/m.138215 type:complete len:414 (+) Transcript_56315:178-1419(+)